MPGGLGCLLEVKFLYDPHGRLSFGRLVGKRAEKFHFHSPIGAHFYNENHTVRDMTFTFLIFLMERLFKAN